MATCVRKRCLHCLCCHLPYWILCYIHDITHTHTQIERCIWTNRKEEWVHVDLEPTMDCNYCGRVTERIVNGKRQFSFREYNNEVVLLEGELRWLKTWSGRPVKYLDSSKFIGAILERGKNRKHLHANKSSIDRYRYR